MSAYVGATALSTAGSAIALIDATDVTTLAGGGNGATFTACYLSAIAVVVAVSAPYATVLASRTSPARVFAASLMAYVVIWAVTGLAILRGVNGFAALILAALPLGVVTAMVSVLGPLMMKAYLGGPSIATAYARITMVRGFAWVAGSLIGGSILERLPAGTGLLVNAAVSIPLVLVVRYVSRATEPASPPRSARLWGDIAHDLRWNGQLRLATILTVGLVVFAAPMASMAVPIAYALREAPVLFGAGILMASIGSGRIVAPLVVSTLSRGRSDITASAMCGVVLGGGLTAFGLTSVATGQRFELGAWFAVGLVCGAAEYSVRALNVGAAVASGPPEHASRSIAALVTAAALAAPIGLLMWGLLINRVSAERAISVGAIGCLAVATWILLRSRSAEKTA